jgi:hypothetical protein
MNGIGRRDDVFSVAATALGQIARAQQGFLPDRETLDARPERGNAASQVISGVGRQRRHPFVDATADQNVGLTDAKRFGSDLHLPRPGYGHRKIDQIKCIHPARLMHENRLHKSISRRYVNFRK